MAKVKGFPQGERLTGEEILRIIDYVGPLAQFGRAADS